MQGYSPKLPLMFDKGQDGVYGLNKTIQETIKQNLKMLLLTSPGERMMDSKFGVGIKRYIFEQDNDDLRNNKETRIQDQIKKYLSYIQIEQIEFSQPDSNQENTIYIKIGYSVPSLNIKDELNIVS